MKYEKNLTKHFQTKKGWVNDPNGLVYFDGYYHVFYQHCPNSEKPEEAMHWGHARTKDFQNWEELPIALYPDRDYDRNGCWSGTAIAKGDTLYLLYASVCEADGKPSGLQSVSVAYSKDGIHFEKCEENPVIAHYPKEGGPDFRDPAIALIDDVYYCVMATGNPETKTGRLLLYRSDNLIEWSFAGIMSEWENCEFCECPSFMQAGEKFLLTASVCPYDKNRYFSVMYGSFQEGEFKMELSSEIDKGPDQYAGQVFRDHKGRNIMITWIPGWSYIGYAETDIGCMSIPREIFEKDGKLYAYPVEEVRHLLTDCDSAVKMTEDGFIIERNGREPVVHTGVVDKLAILRDEYILEVFVNGGEIVYSVLL